MRKLIGLELKRISLKSHFIGLLAANIIILLLCLFLSGFLNILDSFAMMGLPEVELDTIAMALMLVRAVLIVWQAVFIAKIIVEEYQAKTMGLLCTYPYSRQNLVFAKLVLVSGVMLAFHILSSVFQHITIFVLSRTVDFVSYSMEHLLVQVITIIATILLAFIPLSIGIARRSVIATIITGIIIVTFSSSSQGSNAGLLSIPIIAVTMGVIGALITAYTVKKMTASDLNI